MSKLQMVNMKGEAMGDVDWADGLLVLDRGAQAVHDAVVAYQSGRRAGTASTLQKGEVSGSNRKPWKQKGTGRARAGYTRSPVWRGGGVAFGPHPRSYAKKLPKQAARLAFRRAFSEKVAAGEVRVLSDLALAESKTKAFAAMLKALGVGTAALLVVDKLERNLALASRNVPGVEVVTAKGVNTYQMLRHKAVLVTQPALADIKARLESKKKGRAA